MSLILNIETATTVCSVALFKDDKLLASRELNAGYTHAENLHLFIAEVMKEADLPLTGLNAVAVSKGPGSYTGLRIGSSTAKGLAFALNIPLISIDTLKVMAQAALEADDRFQYYVPMIDARRMEVYCAIYDRQLNRQTDIKALIITEDQLSDFSGFERPCFFGEGMNKCQSILKTIPGAGFIPAIVPSAKFMGLLSLKKFRESVFEDVAYFEPFYLKEFVAGLKKGGI